MKKRRLWILIPCIVLVLVMAIWSTLYIGLFQVHTLVDTEFATVTVFPDGQPSGGIGIDTGDAQILSTMGGRILRVTTSLEWGDYRHAVRVGSITSGPENYNAVVEILDEFAFWHFEIDLAYRFDLVRTETFLFNSLLRTSYTTNSVFLRANARSVEAAE